jgi:squalene-hopene/tetraprenyl-beta-curcumene cyclase
MPLTSRTVILTFAVLAICGQAYAQPPADPAARAQALIDSGLAFLKQQQQENGAWHRDVDPPAITAIALRAFLAEQQYTSMTDFIARGLKSLLSYQQDSGGIYKDMQANYNTAIAIRALVAADDPQYQAHIDRAVAFLKRLQWNELDDAAPERSTVDPNDPRYGGFGYGRNERPDGSNLQMALEALHEAGLGPDDPAFQRALTFVTRMQNLSETNDQGWAGDDGGFVYTPARGGESFAGEYVSPDGQRRLRSYGSMTYAGLKSFIYAGLTQDDPRVRAAWEWIQHNWTLAENPGMKLGDPSNAQHGLYYYFHTLARALNQYNQPVITDPHGIAHDWRLELIDQLASLQRGDGSWTGDKRWFEENPVLVTSYVVLALQEAREDLAQHPPR